MNNLYKRIRRTYNVDSFHPNQIFFPYANVNNRTIDYLFNEPKPLTSYNLNKSIVDKQ